MRCWACGFSHPTLGECNLCADQRLRETKRFRWFAIGVLALILVVFAAVDLGVHQWINGDWRCAIAKCRKLVP